METSSALALSGGGYRATLFALGSLWRLNELGILKNLDRITAVSGGSITLGYLALNWNKLDFNNNGVAENFEDVIVKPLQQFCSQNLDIGAGIMGILSPWDTIGDKITKAYNKRLFDKALLSDIPKGNDIPEFIFYATNYTTGSSVRFTNETIYDYKLGEAPVGNITIARAVAASSAFPPIFSPVIFNSKKWNWEKTKYAYLHENRLLRDRLVLTDGGLYDNMGIEAIWKDKDEKNGDDHFDQVFVCDAGLPFEVGFDIKGKNLFSKLIQKTGLKRNWISQLSRMSGVMIDQQRALRKRQLMKNYKNKVYGGAYWTTTTKIANYTIEDKLALDNNLTRNLAKIPTRLKSFSNKDQAHLINWGYVLSDAAIRSYVDFDFDKPKALPIPEYPLE